ncbi:MAG: DUF488 domain-containing protein, partial [Tunicatimonas sp.]
MYYRRKILLSLLEMFDGKLESIHLHKLLMLLSKSQENPSFDFVPNIHGCFSFQADADLKTLMKYEKVIERKDSFWEKIDEKSYVAELKQSDKQALFDVKKEYQRMSSKQLTDVIDRRHPFYALNSEIANANDSGQMWDKQVQSHEIKLFTIGY